MDFTNLVAHASIKKHALGGSGFTGVNVSRDTDITVALNGGMASHDGSLVDLYLQFATHTMRRSERLSNHVQSRMSRLKRGKGLQRRKKAAQFPL
jgi:hypothetical protein